VPFASKRVCGTPEGLSGATAGFCFDAAAARASAAILAPAPSEYTSWRRRRFDLSVCQPEQAIGALSRRRAAHSLDDLVLALEEAEGAVALREVVDEAGQGVDQLRDLVDERRDEHSSQEGEDRQGHDIDRADGRRPSQPAPLSELDGRVEREGQKQGDHDERQAGLGQQHELDGRDHRQDDAKGP
jgi:hypothetical protein